MKEKKKYLNYMAILALLIILSSILMVITFRYSSANVNQEIFSSYFKSFGLIMLNIVPIFVFMSIVYLISNKMWLSFFTTSILFVTASLVNKFKLTYRDDPFTLIDVKLFSESLTMAKRYEINFERFDVLIIAGLIVVTLLLMKFFKRKIASKNFRLITSIVMLTLALVSIKPVYLNAKIYDQIGDKSLINIWSEQQQFQSKGFVYPFIYSTNSVGDPVIEGYDEEKAKNDLKKYKYNDIPKDEKVNVVGIMLEAYNDFSKFEDLEIDDEVYADFHKIQKESLHGDLVTNVFAGGTINTERGFLTGLHHHPRYLQDTNSFVRYFKEQGYTTKAMHPIYGWFYKRNIVNEYLGFDSFDYYENKYQAIKEEFFDDLDFFDFIIEDYEKTVAKEEPYFHFTVTYQNHGPYSDQPLAGKEYLKRQSEYNDSDYNIVNNYLKGISETGKAMKKLTDYFENEDEPVVVVMFGDHNPWLGEDASAYEMLNIDIDPSTEEGFLNYYKTPYVIWGNSKAKEVLDKDFKGELEDISPNFLMNELFEYLDWKGNEYMQYSTDVKKDIDVNHEIYFKEHGDYTKELSGENEKKYQSFRNLQYYYGRNLMEKK